MAASAVQDHLALLARTGMMSHVAELDSPVTAEAMSRFRADAAARASNVMALGSGRFALCLGSGVREIRTEIAHHLRPIAEVVEEFAGPARSTGAPETSDQTAGAGHPPRRIPPPSDRAAPEPPQSGSGAERRRLEEPSGAPAPLAAGPDLSGVVAAIAEGQFRLATGLDDLMRSTARLAEKITGGEQRIAEDLERLACRIGEAGADADNRLDRCVAGLESALAAQEGRARARIEAAEARLAEGAEAAHAAQMEAIGHVSQDLRSLSLGLAEQETRQSESLATIRLSLRGLADRIAEISGSLRAAATPDGGAAEWRIDGIDQGLQTNDGTSPAPVTMLRPKARDAQDAQPRREAEPERLRLAVAELLAQLDASLQPAAAGATRDRLESGMQTPLWRRAARTERDERNG